MKLNYLSIKMLKNWIKVNSTINNRANIKLIINSNIINKCSIIRVIWTNNKDNKIQVIHLTFNQILILNKISITINNSHRIIIKIKAIIKIQIWITKIIILIKCLKIIIWPINLGVIYNKILNNKINGNKEINNKILINKINGNKEINSSTHHNSILHNRTNRTNRTNRNILISKINSNNLLNKTNNKISHNIHQIGIIKINHKVIKIHNKIIIKILNRIIKFQVVLIITWIKKNQKMKINLKSVR